MADLTEESIFLDGELREFVIGIAQFACSCRQLSRLSLQLVGIFHDLSGFIRHSHQILHRHRGATGHLSQHCMRCRGANTARQAPL